jgi:FlaG/FlaF family flagellin (archaellin)
MKHWKLFGVLLLLATGYSESARSQQPQAQTPPPAQTKIPAGSKVFVAPMGGFETPLRKAIADKKVPVEIVEQREQAEYEITGTADSKKAGTAKKVIMGSWRSDEEASIKMANLKTGEMVYAYAVHKKDSAHGQRSTAEACAKHLKDEAVAAK